MARAEKGGLSPEDAALWRHVTRGVDRRAAPERAAEPKPRAAAKPSEPKKKAPAKPPPAKTKATKPASPVPPSGPPVAVEVVKSRPPASRGRLPGVDKRSALKLQRGQLPIEGRLDLHGMAQGEAYRALDVFLARAARDGKRCVLVITGKGTPRRDEGVMPDRSAGILRRLVPRWLGDANNRERILAQQPAQPKDGGSGAIYVLLKRRRRGRGGV